MALLGWVNRRIARIDENVHTLLRLATSATAKVFTIGNGQAIRLPKAFRLDTDGAWIRKSSDCTLTIQPTPKGEELDAFLAELQATLPSDAFLQRRDVAR